MYRVLVVDDEKEIRNGLVTQMPWGEWNVSAVYAADDGDTALELVKRHQPDIIVTDIKMKRVSVMEMVAELYEKRRFKGKTVIISGYDEFSYARDAIKHGVMDYLLKPIHSGEFGRVIRKAIEELHHERQMQSNRLRIEQKLTQVLPKLREEFLQELIERVYSVSVEARIAVTLPEVKLEWLAGSKLAILVAEVDDLMNQVGGKPVHEVELLLFAVGNVMEQTLAEENAGRSIVFRTKSNRTVAILERKPEAPWTPEQWKPLARLIVQRIRTYVKVSVSIGTASAGGIDRLHDMYESAVESVLFQKIYGAAEDPDAEEIEAREGLLSRHDEVVEMLKYAGEEEIREIMGHFPALVKTWGVHQPRDLQQRSFEWLMQIHQSAAKAGWKESSWDSGMIMVWKQMDRYDTLESIRKFLTGQLLTIAAELKERFEPQSQIVHHAEKFIRDHYAENITLKTVADHVHVTQVWLSQLFKKEKGMTFLEYLTDVRMEKAKELLCDVNLRVYQICHMVGYQDTVHFGKLFKKKVGYTPREYRNMRGINGD
jgi:two-component system response regulator YesN